MMASRPSTPLNRSIQTLNEPILGATSNVRVAVRVRPLNKRGDPSFPLECRPLTLIPQKLKRTQNVL